MLTFMRFATCLLLQQTFYVNINKIVCIFYVCLLVLCLYLVEINSVMVINEYVFCCYYLYMYNFCAINIPLLLNYVMF
jgi:hypothetical protein